MPRLSSTSQLSNVAACSDVNPTEAALNRLWKAHALVDQEVGHPHFVENAVADAHGVLFAGAGGVGCLRGLFKTYISVPVSTALWRHNILWNPVFVDQGTLPWTPEREDLAWL